MTVSDRLIDALEAGVSLDGETMLPALARAVCTELDYIDGLSADPVAWSTLLDLNNCPDSFLPYLGQFMGVAVPLDITPANQRIVIQQAQGRNRGTVASIISAVQTTLTGTKQVIVVERYTSAYTVQITTYQAETPDPTATQAAAQAALPAGLILTYVNSPGINYSQLDTKYGTYTDMKNTNKTYDDLRKLAS